MKSNAGKSTSGKSCTENKKREGNNQLNNSRKCPRTKDTKFIDQKSLQSTHYNG